MQKSLDRIGIPPCHSLAAPESFGQAGRRRPQYRCRRVSWPRQQERSDLPGSLPLQNPPEGSASLSDSTEALRHGADQAVGIQDELPRRSLIELHVAAGGIVQWDHGGVDVVGDVHLVVQENQSLCSRRCYLVA